MTLLRKRFQRKNIKAFTLIELLVVIAVIAVLASVIFASFGGATSTAQDGTRRTDLAIIRDALQRYNLNNGTFIESNSGCGAYGDGSGSFAHANSGDYGKSIMQCLIDAGYLDRQIVDPSGQRTADSGRQSGYMKYSCRGGTFLYAQLETQESIDIPQNACARAYVISMGMNYGIRVEEPVRR